MSIIDSDYGTSSGTAIVLKEGGGDEIKQDVVTKVEEIKLQKYGDANDNDTNFDQYTIL